MATRGRVDPETAHRPAGSRCCPAWFVVPRSPSRAAVRCRGSRHRTVRELLGVPG